MINADPIRWAIGMSQYADGEYVSYHDYAILLAEAERLRTALATREAVVVPECFMALYRAALGLTHGTDWNKGTAASFHRVPLIDATGRCAELLAASQQAKEEGK